ncbi:MAG: DinB family protein [Bacteroidota bacterium]
MTFGELLEESKNLVEQLSDTVKEEFRPLSIDQLNWKPSAKKWSVIECLDHINTAGRHYIKHISKNLDLGQNTNSDLNREYHAGFWGKKAAESMKPAEGGVIKNKMSTFPSMMPDYSNLNTEMVIDETDYQFETFLNLIKRSENYDLEKVKIKSLLGGLLMFKLGDAYSFSLNHAHRHIVQAKNVMKHQYFPR